MNRFAELLDRLSYEASRNNKLRLITAYLRETPDPDRGYALAALTGALSFKHAKPALIRELIASRTDPVLFALSYDYVGDLSETVALMWPTSPLSSPLPTASPLPPPLWGRSNRDAGREGGEPTNSALENHPPPYPSPTWMEGTGNQRGEAKSTPPLLRNSHTPTLTEIIQTLDTLPKRELPAQLAQWLDELDETGRWALLKLVTGSLRIGVSARLAKTATAALGEKEANEVELVWPGLEAPYLELFAWLEGRAERPVNLDPAPFRPVMLAHAIEDTDFAALNPAEYVAEWKWDGIRVQAVTGLADDNSAVTRLYSRSGEDITGSFPDLLSALHKPGAIDGELLVLKDSRVQTFNVLQQRLNRKSVTPKLMKDYPIYLRAYDLLDDGETDLRTLPFEERRQRLEAHVAALNNSRVDLSPVVPFTTWDELASARENPASSNAGDDADAVEGVMLKRRDAAYVPGRPKGQWWKWKRDPHIVDAVLMYAQRGHGKRSSYYSDYTFGVWQAGEQGDQLVPVGKAYFGFTDEELIQIDKFVRRYTTDRFGPVRQVVHEPDKGLVLEVAFEGLQRSTRHKSGVAMRFPRISRLRWDKPPREADRIETLERMLKSETDVTPVEIG